MKRLLGKGRRMMSLVLALLLVAGVVAIGFVASAAGETTTIEKVSAPSQNGVSGTATANSDGSISVSALFTIYAWMQLSGKNVFVYAGPDSKPASGSAGTEVASVAVSAVDGGTVSVDLTIPAASATAKGYTIECKKSAGDSIWGWFASPGPGTPAVGIVFDGGTPSSFSVVDGSKEFSATTDAGGGEITWSVEPEGIVSLASSATQIGDTSKMVVTAIKPGNAVLKVENEEGGEATQNVTITADGVMLKVNDLDGTAVYPVGKDKPFELQVAVTGGTLNITPNDISIAVLTADDAGIGAMPLAPSASLAYAFTATKVGTTKVRISLWGDVLSVTLDIISSEQSGIGFTIGGAPIDEFVSLTEGGTVTITPDADVDHYEIDDPNGAVDFKNPSATGKQALNFEGKTIGGIATIKAFDSSGKQVGIFSITVVPESGPFESEIIENFSPFASVAGPITLKTNVGASQSPESYVLRACCSVVQGQTTYEWKVEGDKPGAVTISESEGGAVATVTASSAGTVTISVSANYGAYGKSPSSQKVTFVIEGETVVPKPLTGLTITSPADTIAWDDVVTPAVTPIPSDTTDSITVSWLITVGTDLAEIVDGKIVITQKGIDEGGTFTIQATSVVNPLIIVSKTVTITPKGVTSEPDVSSPVSNPASNPVSNPASSPVSNPASSPVSNPASSPVSNPASNTVSNPVSNPQHSAEVLVMRLNSTKALLDGADIAVDPSNKEVSPFTLNGKTMVPVRFVQQLGANVKYDSDSEPVIVSYGDVRLELVFDSDIMKKTVGSAAPVEIKLPTAPTMVEGKTCVPIREVAEHLGFSVRYDSASFVIVASIKVLTPAQLTAKIEEGKTLPTRVEAVRSISVSPETQSIGVGGGNSVTIDRSMVNFTTDSGEAPGCNLLVYSSSNTDIATVTSRGRVIGVAPGTVTITVKSHNGKEAKVTVTVK